MFFRLRPLKLQVLEKQWKNDIRILVQKFSEMQFQPIWSASFSKFSGGACPQTPLAGQKFCPTTARRRQIFVSHLEPTHIFSWICTCNVYCHNKVSSYRSTHSYFWVVCRCSVGTTVTITSVIMCCTEVCGHLVMSFITIKVFHKDLLIHIFGWYADVLWAQLVHSFDQVVGRVLLCGHLIIHTVSIHH